MTPGYSFIIPVYRSVNSLEPLYMGIVELMEQMQESYEVIFVEDHGSAESWQRLLELKKQHPAQIRLIRLTKNFGQNGATLCGIDEARGNILLTIDDDLQVHPSELKKLIDFQAKHQSDVVYGVYKEKSAAPLRNTGSRLVKIIFSRTESGSNIGSSIRLITAHIASHLRSHSQDHLFINQVISWYTFDAGFVEIQRHRRFDGKSGYSFLQLFRMAFRLLFLYTSLPLKLMIALCVTGSLGSLLLAAYYTYRHFILGRDAGLQALIVIAISLILASISIMGIYINRIYSSRVKKPHYAIKQKL